MYTAGIITGAIILAVIGAVDYFWIFPEDVTIGKWISLILAVLILFDVLISPYFRYHRYRYSINECRSYLCTTRSLSSASLALFHLLVVPTR